MNNEQTEETILHRWPMMFPSFLTTTAYLSCTYVSLFPFHARIFPTTSRQIASLLSMTGVICHWSFGPGKYGPACTILPLKYYTRVSARTRAMSRARARARTKARVRARAMVSPRGLGACLRLGAQTVFFRRTKFARHAPQNFM